MKSSELWLREWVNPAIDSDALSNQTTMADLEVDGVEPVPGVFNDVVVGEVVECGQHPNANKSRVTKVNVDGNRLLDIVCGAPNCRQGLKVVVATVGAALPGDLKAKAARPRGEPSEGMLCSFSELGISDDRNRIIELPTDAPIGTDICEYPKSDDNTIEISVTSNRADCLGITGVARDAAALNKAPLVEPEFAPVAVIVSDVLSIQVEAVEACPRYLGHVVKGINVKASTPLWMKEKLHRYGTRSIGAVVDVTNYALPELDQLMHAFDKDRIEDGIVVRMAEEGETLVLLDGNEVKLNADMLVTADHSKALVMDGIFSGEHSGVNDETQNVLLECALFSPLSIIGRARCHGLYTDVFHRCERGVDPALQRKAMERTTRLLIDTCGGEAGLVISVTNEATLSKRATITLRCSKLDRLTGHHIVDEQVSDILRRLGCDVTEGQDEWKAVAPSWCFGMEIEEDLVEEVTRVYGYDSIPNTPIQAGLIMGTHREAGLSLKRVRTILNDKGYKEVTTYSFVDPKVQSLLHPGGEALLLPNPISIDILAMRLSLWIGLLSTVVRNQNRQQNRVRTFETGLRFVPDTQANLGIRQDPMLAGVVCGNRHDKHWNLAKETADFYDLKGDLKVILDLIGKLGDTQFKAEVNPALHPGQSAAIYLKGERIGFTGVAHPGLERKLDPNGRTLVFELEWNKLADRVVPQAREVSYFPANRRDTAVVVAENVPAADILSEYRKVGVNQVVGVNLFDVYHGEGVAEGYKSLIISLTLQDTSHAFEEEEIAVTVAKRVEASKERFQVSLRD